MALNRRSALKAAGLLCSGAGVELARASGVGNSITEETSIAFVPDSTARLRLLPGHDREWITYTEAEDGSLQVTLTNLNRNAITEIEQLLTIQNEGIHNISAIDITVEDQSTDGAIMVAADVTTPVQPGGTTTGVTLTIGTGNSVEPFQASITISVETTA